MDGWMDGWMGGWKDGWMDGWIVTLAWSHSYLAPPRAVWGASADQTQQSSGQRAPVDT
jgi:hypothetical protein